MEKEVAKIKQIFYKYLLLTKEINSKNERVFGIYLKCRYFVSKQR